MHTPHTPSPRRSVEELLAVLRAAEAGHRLAGDVGVAVVVHELDVGLDVAEGEEGDAREARVVVAEDALLEAVGVAAVVEDCLLYTSPSPRDGLLSRMPSSA